MSPRRIQRSRQRRNPKGVVYVGRGRGDYGKFGNPITIAMVLARYPNLTEEEAARVAATGFDEWLGGSTEWVNEPERRQRILDSLPELRGRDLLCWCRDGAPCHGDVLLRRANATQERNEN